MAAGKLREAAARGNLEKVLHLIEEGVKIQPDENGRNALHLAASAGHADVVAALLLAGCDVNVPDSSGCTALQRAAAEGHLEVVKQLIKYGADVNRQDSVHGNTALHEASWKGYSQSVAALAKAKANLHLKNCGGFAALHLCCQNGHNQSCRELLLAGCNPDLQNNYGDTPLHTSARYGHAGVTRILISATCRVSDQNKNGDTALHIAAAMGRRKLTRILLEAGCDKSLKNKQNETAKDIATRKDLNEILVILNNPTISRSKNKSGKSTYEKDHNDKKRGKNESGNSSKDSSSRQKEKKKHKNAHKVHFERPTGKQWSPYGCHYYPDPKAFPQPKLDSLPHEPLKKGEQYYLDLAGNICKGPVGVGYTCYCAPFFRHMEARLDRDKQELKEHIDQAHQRLDQKVTNLEHRTQGQISELTQCVVAERARCDQRHLHLAQWLSRGAAGRSSERVRMTEPLDFLDPFPVPRARSLEQLLDSHVEWKDLHQDPVASGYTVGGTRGLRNAQDHRSLEMLADDNGNATWARQHYQNSAHVLRSREQKQQRYYERTNHEETIPKGQPHQPYIQELTKRVKQKDQDISKVKQDLDKRLENPKAEKNASNWRGQPHRRSAHELPFCTNTNNTNNHEHSSCPDKHNRSFDTLLDQRAGAWQDHSQYRSVNELPSALHQRKHETVFGKVQTDHHRSLNNVLVDKELPNWSEKGRGSHETGMSVGETNTQAPQSWKVKTQKRAQEAIEDKQNDTQVDNGSFDWKEQPLCRSVHEMVQRYQSVHGSQPASNWSVTQNKQNRGDSTEGQRPTNTKINELKEVSIQSCRQDERLKSKSHYGGVEHYRYHNDDDNPSSESSEGEDDDNQPEVKNPDYENVMAACQWRPERARLMSDISYHPCGAVYSPTMESSDLHNDSGYSTKLYGSSKGPSPSLSGQLECEGILPPQALFNQNKVPTVCEQNQKLQSRYAERSDDTKTSNVVTASLV